MQIHLIGSNGAKLNYLLSNAYTDMILEFDIHVVLGPFSLKIIQAK
jgi:hypothetical protein